MSDLNSYARRVNALATQLGVRCTISLDALSIQLEEMDIPVKGYRIFAHDNGRRILAAESRTPAHPEARLYLSSLVPRGTPRYDLTNGRAHAVASFFGYHWANWGENSFLFGIHVGSYIELDWD